MAVYPKLGAEAFGHSVTGLLESLPEYGREELLSLLRGRIADLRGKLLMRLVSLFGSYAKGRQTAAGDIDLLVSTMAREGATTISWFGIHLVYRDFRSTYTPWVSLRSWPNQRANCQGRRWIRA